LDLGADHGYVPIALVRRGETQVYASDVAEKPLARAKANAARRGVAGAITFLLADGVPGELRGKIGYVIIAGMGGESIAAILGTAPWVKSDGVKLILQPQSKRDFLRGWLRDNGYEIQCDSGITDGGRKYYIWSVE
jgi:tRNA (adenine22-N1)-methyltransferase